MAQSASSGGASVSHLLNVGISTFFSPILGVLPMILIGLEIVVGIWNGIRNAPTLRARQWMLKVTLGYVIVGSLIFMLLQLSRAYFDLFWNK